MHLDLGVAEFDPEARIRHLPGQELDECAGGGNGGEMS
jgi:hypothetical protein